MQKILTIMPNASGKSDRKGNVGNPFFDGAYSRFFVYCFDNDMCDELERTCKDLGAYEGNDELCLKKYGNGIYEVSALGDLHVADLGRWSMVYRKFFMYSNDVRSSTERNQRYHPVTISATLNMNAVCRLA